MIPQHGLDDLHAALSCAIYQEPGSVGARGSPAAFEAETPQVPNATHEGEGDHARGGPGADGDHARTRDDENIDGEDEGRSDSRGPDQASHLFKAAVPPSSEVQARSEAGDNLAERGQG